jgi:hypothetical protein
MAMRYVCARCGRLLEPDEYAGCRECGYRGRRPAPQAALTSADVPEDEPPQVQTRQEWERGVRGEWFGSPPLPHPALALLPRTGYVWRWFYIAPYVAGVAILAVGVTALVVLTRADDPSLRSWGLLWCLLGVTGVGMAVAAAGPSLLLHAAWQAIQDSHVRMKPATAVAYCFIPLYNLYWIFHAVAGFAADFNRFAVRYRTGAFRASPGLYQAFCACVACSIIPCVQIATVPLALGLAVAVMADMCAAINAVADAQARLDAGEGPGDTVPNDHPTRPEAPRSE